MYYTLMKNMVHVAHAIRRTAEGRATRIACHLDVLFSSAGGASMFMLIDVYAYRQP